MLNQDITKYLTKSNLIFNKFFIILLAFCIIIFVAFVIFIVSVRYVPRCFRPCMGYHIVRGQSILKSVKKIIEILFELQLNEVHTFIWPFPAKVLQLSSVLRVWLWQAANKLVNRTSSASFILNILCRLIVGVSMTNLCSWATVLSCGIYTKQKKKKFHQPYFFQR